MRCPIDELFTLKECPKCGGQAIWKMSRYADGCSEQCMGCGEVVEKPEVPNYWVPPACPPDADAAVKMQQLKKEHDAVRVHIGRVEECIRDGERALNSPGEGEIARLRKQAFTLYYTLAYLKEAAQRHEEREDDMLRCYLQPELAQFIEKQHEDIRAGISRATEVIGKVLPGQVDKNQLLEFCISIRRILEPLFARWKEHLTVADAILDNLSSKAGRVAQPA